MVYQFVAVSLDDIPLQFFDVLVDEFDDLAGFEAHHVIVVLTIVQFVNGPTTFEIVPGHEARMLELGQHPIHGRKTNLFPRVIQFPVDILGAEVMLGAFLEQPEDFQPRSGDF